MAEIQKTFWGDYLIIYITTRDIYRDKCLSGLNHGGIYETHLYS